MLENNIKYRNILVLPRNYLVVLLFCLSVISIFINVIKIYHFVFFLFFGVILLTHKESLLLNKRFLLPSILALLFVLYSSIVFIFYLEQSDLKTFIKLITNLFFLFSSFILASILQSEDFYTLKRSLSITLRLIIILTFFQLILNLTITNSWLLPFSGQLNSVVAFQLTEVKVFFGESQKNIWSSKFMLISIAYLIGYRLNVFNVSSYTHNLYYLIILFCIFFMLSRSAQLAFLLFEFSFHSIDVLHRKSGIKFKIVIYIVIALSLLILLYFSFYLLRLDYNFYDVSKGHGGDGFKARIILWIYFFNNFENLNLIFGNGILFTDYYFNGIFSESNLHNSFLNVFVDSGMIGTCLYFLMAISIIKVIKHKQKPWILFVQLVPIISIMNVQYLGYDNDIIIYLSLIAIINLINNKIQVDLYTSR